jgi:autotransporter translocation and assembly factor TamB
VRATARLEPTAFVIDNVSVTHGDANLEASAQLALVDPPEPSRVEATWRDFDTLALVRELELELPYTPAGIVSGHGAVTWTASNLRGIQFETEITSRAQEDQSGVVPFGGVARINVQDGRWRAELDEMSVPGLSVNARVDGQLPPSDAPASEATLQGGVVVTASDLAQMARTFGLTGLAGDDAAPGITGAATAEITLTGAVGSPIADGQIFDARIGYQGIEGIDLRSVFSADESGISLDQLTAEFGPNLIDGTLRLDLDASTVDGVLDIRLSDLSALAPVVPAAVAPTGRLDARATVAGSLDAPHLEADVEGHDLTVGGRPLDQLSASASLDDGVLRIETLEVRQHEGLAQLSGSYTLADGTYELDVTGRELALESLAATTPDDSSLSGQLQFGIAAAGSLSDPSAMGTVRIDALDWSGRSLGVADLALEIDGGILRLDAGIPSLSATAQAEVGLIGDTTFNLTADFLRTELERLLPPTTGDTPPPDVSGVASLHLTASGDRTALADARATLEIRELDGLVGPTRLRLVDPGGLEYAGGTVTTERLELLLDDTRLTLAGLLTDAASGRLSATLVGDLSNFEPLIAMVGAGGDAPPALNLAGAIDSEILVTGSFGDPEISAQIQVRDGSVAFDEIPPLQDLNLDLRYDMQAVRLERLDGTWQGANITGRGDLPVGLLVDHLPDWLTRETAAAPMARMSFNAENLTTEALTAFVDPESLENIEVYSAAQLDIEANGLALEEVRAGLRFGDLDLVFAEIPFNQRRETWFELADGRIQVRTLDLGNDEDYLTLGGTVDLSGERAADLTVTGEVDLRALSAFAATAVTEGNALLIANVQGPLDDPQISGTIELTGAGLRMADPPLVVSNLNGALLLTRDTIQLHELAGEANGGPLQITGSLDLVGLQPRGDVSITGRGIAMELPEGVRTEIDADVTVGLTADEIALGGTVTVLRGAYRETLLLTSGLLAALQEQESLTIIGIDQPSPLDSVILDFRLVSAEDIIVDNNYANASVGFDLRLVGTAGAPAVTGRAALAEGGQVRLGNRLYQIETGTVDFIDPTGIEPELGLTARTRVAGRDITVTIAGVPDALTTEFQSDPPESESDIVSLLLTGRTLEEVGVAPQAAAAEQALGLASTEFLGTAGRSVGLDTLRVEQDVDAGQIRFDSSLVATETDPSTRLTVGKNLSDQVQLIASQDLAESGQLTWIVEYLPRRNIELRFVVDDVNNKSYAFRHAVSLGRPPRPLETSSTPRR